MPATPTIINLLTASLDTLATLRLQLTNLHTALLAPSEPTTPPSPDNTLLVPGGTPGGAILITDSSHQTWQLLPNGPSATPTLFLNGYPDPFTGPASLALYLNQRVYFQRITGQWYFWATNHWSPTADPQPGTASPDWGPPALRAADGAAFNWLPDLQGNVALNYDLLADLFTDNSHNALTFLPSPIPITIRPRGTKRPPVYQRSDNTFILPLFDYSTPITIQFPGLRPTYIRLWNAIDSTTKSPTRVATGTDTIAVPMTRGAFYIIELSLG